MNNEDPATFALCGQPWKDSPPLTPGVYVVTGEGAQRMAPEVVSALGNLARRALRKNVDSVRCSPRRRWDRGPLKKNARRVESFFSALAETGRHPTLCAETLNLCRKALRVCAEA